MRDHISTIGVDVVVDEAEGYAYLRQRDDEESRRSRFPAWSPAAPCRTTSACCWSLLRKRLAEFDATEPARPADPHPRADRRDARVFLPDTTNEARRVDQVDSTSPRSSSWASSAGCAGCATAVEVRRILKAYVDAQTLADFDGRLAE